MSSTDKIYKNRPVTANAVVVQKGKTLLIKRRSEPFKDYWAIPGGFVDINESTSACALRELKEETGLSGEIVQLVGVYDAPDRDPRHTVNIAYLVKPKKTVALKASDDATDARWFPISSLPKLAFDHAEIIKDTLLLKK